jgi:hypothetical protein
MSENAKNLSQGSDYGFFASDRFTPSTGQAPPLEDNIQSKFWGKTPLDFVKWFDKIWHTGDPAQWGPQVFTSDAVMIDSTGLSIGAAPAASDFLLLFKYFPSLRGEVVSWGQNEREIFINWRFVVSQNCLVPVVDKFSFINGLVSFRMAYFDTVTFLSYLAENYGAGPLVDYFLDRFWRSAGGGGILFAPGLLWALFKGLFRWSDMPLAAPTGLSAMQSDGTVKLAWNPVQGAASYTVKRSEVRGGPYPWLAPLVPENNYIDKTAKPGTQYFYVVSANPPGDTVILPEPQDSPS